jgi:hypothetical protein
MSWCLLLSRRLRRAALCRFAERSNVGNILGPSSRQFRRYQVLTGNERRREASLRVDYNFNPSFPGAIKINAVNFWEKWVSL